MDSLKDYMTVKKLNPLTRRKIVRYFEIKYSGRMFDEAQILGEMNDSLQTEIAVNNCKMLIEKVPFLRRQLLDGRDEIFTGRIARSLVVAYYVAGDFIINQGEIGTEMFFLVSGRVNIIVNGNIVTSFTDGAFFGEVALIANIPRTATVMAAQACMLYTLKRTDFLRILSDFEDVRARIEEIYRERMVRVKKEEEEKRVLEKERGTGK
ncbi:hypothetical protein HK101_011072 [Irineochytrium annulatum]|nr:hypothetical protein HK101_011072 [Irineochytrium annulatum]